ncbi:MAG: helix-turn-helix domain-containing protein [Prevotellaceae bacterium]|jgi:transcriptional regulator with XRE-family HTH domain|nr:helix-turn-helix domain-containing protein [Prevotellaceae bacterium]
MLIDSKLKLALKKNGITQNNLCQEISMTAQGLRKAILTKTLSIGTIEKMSDVLHVPINYWFSEKSNENIGSSVKDVFQALEKIVAREMNKN